MKPVTLGILGGLGPASGVYFAQMLVEHTKAERDQEHLNFLLSSRADTPDRTEYILGRSECDPSPTMIEEVNRLVAAGADAIAIPCNTAHYFYDRVAEASRVPILNIIDLTMAFCQSVGAKTIGALATEGTVISGAYEKVCEAEGVAYLTSTESQQTSISRLIYDEIKCGREPDLASLTAIAEDLLARGADKIVLGCTELSLIKRRLPKHLPIVDSLEVLALSAIRYCGKEPIGFDPLLMKFIPVKGTLTCY
ncbi:MAG: aspartate/glutamate racemase family protein [Clostridia bacterium]|nr:aspartate/glutamate racemase family protein [Clostridia bacterium]